MPRVARPGCVMRELWRRCAVLLIAAVAGVAAGETRPNFVIFFVDDLGFGDLASYGHPAIATPRLDALAAAGQRWTNFYSAAAVCSPSRAALLTGRLPVRTGMYGQRVGVLFPGAEQGLPTQETTIAEVLSARGYATAILGKWHLGDADSALPTRHGFDYWYGTPYSNDMNPADGIGYFEFQSLPKAERARITERRNAELFAPRSKYWNLPLLRSVVADGKVTDTVLETSARQGLLTRRITKEATDFIARQRNQPFLLVITHPMPHTPIFPGEAFAGKSRAGRYGDVVEELDWSVGEVVDALAENGLGNDTLILFTSDNGPWLSMHQHGGSAGPLRDGKGTTFEGGVRVPAIFYWPGRVAPGVIRDIGSVLDVMPTVLGLAGADAGAAVDGYDLAPVLLRGAPGPRREMAYYRGGTLYAYRLGAYKLHLVTEGAYGSPPKRTEQDPPLLYHLGEDPGERFDIAANNPAVVQKILDAIERHRREVPVKPPLFDRQFDD